MALKWGIVDVQGWLESLPRGALDFWDAFDSVEPIGEEWMQTAMIAHQASLGVYCKAGREPPSIEDYMPGRFQREKKAAAGPTKEQFAGLMQHLGFKVNADGNND